MANYVLLTRLTPEAIKNPKNFEEINDLVTAKIKRECPEVKWLANYSVLGPYDYLDIFEAPDNDSATKVAVIIRSFGNASTEIWPAVEWDRFRQITKLAAAA